MPDKHLIRGGDVYDGEGGPPLRGDVLIEGDRVAAIGPSIEADGAEIIDATGLIVSPGLIDLHVHVCDGVGIYSIDPAAAGLKTGVTTMLDFGSAGCLAYPVFQKYVMPAAQEDVFALLHVSQHGCQGNPRMEPFVGELTDVRHVHVPSCVECVQKYPERILGIKVRLSSDLAAEHADHEYAGLFAAVEAAEQTGLPLMIHHKVSHIPIDEALAALRPGDVYTHVYHAGATSGFCHDTGAPLDTMRAARQRGILFDVGHGVGSFGWRVAEAACVEHGFWPDTISTDLHALCLHGPVFDLPTTMSKFLHLGMPVEAILRAVTSAAADAMRLGDQFGRLAVGRQADVTLLRIEEGEFEMTDTVAETRSVNRRFVPETVFKRGERFEIAPAFPAPRAGAP